MTFDLRRRSAEADEILAHRLDELIPVLMRRAGVQAWVLIAREYNEDPVVTTMLPSTWMAARRRTILLFLDDGTSVRRLAVARYGIAGLFEGAWDPGSEPDQWAALARLLGEADPGSIAINRSETFALADGLSATEHAQLLAALPPSLRQRVVSRDGLAIGWLETRTAREMEVYPSVVRTSHELLRTALSSAVIDPNLTTTEDVAWWLRQSVHDRGLQSWFQPTVSVQRPRQTQGSFSQRPGDEVIGRGDLIHVDFGLVDGGLHTDMQQHAYVLNHGERTVPAGLSAGLAVANRLQDLLMAEFAVGRPGNEVLAAARSAADREGIRATVYTHPIGLHGHAAGPTIGLWDQQAGVSGAGDYPLNANTAYSIELMAEVAVPEWDDQLVAFMLEEDAYFDGHEVTFLDGRQTELWVV